MPELPEVETVVRDLRPLVTGRRVVCVEAGGRKLRTPWDPAWGPGPSSSGPSYVGPVPTGRFHVIL